MDAAGLQDGRRRSSPINLPLSLRAPPLHPVPPPPPRRIPENSAVTPLLLTADAAPAAPHFSRRKRFLLLWAIWSAIAIFFASQAVAFVLAMMPRDKIDLAVVWQRQLLFNFVCYYLWWALTPLIVRLDRRWRLEGAGWARAAWVHGFASLLLGAVHLPVSQLIFKVIYNPLTGWSRFMPGLWPLFRDNIHLNILTYWVILGVYYVLDYHHRWREREVHAAELERALSPQGRGNRQPSAVAGMKTSSANPAEVIMRACQRSGGAHAADGMLNGFPFPRHAPGLFFSP